jgi:hypothetical protein
MRTARRSLCVLAASLAAVLAGSSPARADLPPLLPICTPVFGQTCSGNLALNAITTSSHLPCTLGSGPENAVDGAASNVYTDKWCVRSGQPTLTISLPVYIYGFTLSKIVVKHAGVAGESSTFNTRAYRLTARTTSPFCAPKMLATVTNNILNQTVHTVTNAWVRQVQLDVLAPTQGTGGATRIYEVEVWGTPSTQQEPPGC